ncbi:MAG: L-threonylcarbamoyladenylate synthase, partial [Cyclobacteriaceae bacterium]|nr:L-threonylcarbamoyladenylate synthase [Cyclobacteriaceae bacterium]
LMKKFWPGPLTLLLPKKEIIPDLVTSGLDRVGIRCPDHPLTHQLLKNLSFPLAAPSANPFGYVSPTTAEHVNDQLGKKISYILDGGPSMVGIESTIVGWEGGIPVIYRMGGISQEMIESVIGKVATLAQSTSQPQAPGQLASHYAPKKKFLLGHLETLAKENAPARLGILAFQKGIETNGRATQLILSPIGNLEEAARNLFSMLRQLDTHDIDMVIAEEVPNIGLGRAINDRLRRAAASYPQISQIK